MRKRALLLTVIALLGSAQLVRAQVVVAPGAQATTEGSVSNFYPFAIDISDPGNPLFNANPLTSQRYQQVYDQSLFAGYTGPLAIQQISFRPDSEYGSAFDAVLPSVQISLSTTSRSMAELTGVFADNLGSDNTVIWNGSLSLSSDFTGPADGPKAFDISIDMATPFLYDPSQGNLVLDIRNYEGVAGDPPLGMVFDAEISDEVSRLYTGAPLLDGVLSPTATWGPGGMGLVTQFTFTTGDVVAVPAPGALLLGLLGTGLVGCLRRRTL